ncbi:FecR domain-containing protein [Draconibacterium orientale]|uniref:FecR family protein n=1 Tax=Draconibacterium orientale TaxID=1168034 RepID=UPI002A0A3400|nr:FecR domain-containing protein [Draconibacterium orientale]
MKEKINIKALLNFSEGKYSYNDYLKVKDWFNNIGEQGQLKAQLFSQWEDSLNDYNGNDKSLNHIFEKIQHNILLEEKKEAKKINIWSFYRQVAAILLIPVLAFSVWNYISLNTDGNNTTEQMAQSWVEICAPDGGKVEFLLPDSTSGWLNSGSKLRYNPMFSKKRKVELTGEAWFDVKHINDRDFVVSVPDMDVKVLGTEFNVSAYPEDDFTNVVLEEGIVEVNGKAGVFNQILAPNEKIAFNHEEKSLTLTRVNAEHFSAWKEGYLIIDNEPLGDVVGRLERWYNVEIKIQDEMLKRYRFKATFKDEPLEEVLRLMAKTTPIAYKIEKRSEDASGVFKKKEVLIKLRQ